MTNQKLLAAAKFSVRDRAEIRPARRCPALPRVKEVPKDIAERRHAAACGIACEIGAVRTENFRKKIAAENVSVRGSPEMA